MKFIVRSLIICLSVFKYACSAMRTLPEGDGIPHCGGGHDTGPRHVQPSTSDQPNESRSSVFVTEEGRGTRAVDVHPLTTVAELITEFGYQPTDYQLFIDGQVEHLDPVGSLSDQGVCSESVVQCAPIRLIDNVLTSLRTRYSADSVSEERFLRNPSVAFWMNFDERSKKVFFNFGDSHELFSAFDFERGNLTARTFFNFVDYLKRKVGGKRRVEVRPDEGFGYRVNVYSAS